MAWKVKEKERDASELNDDRVFLTDGKEEFFLDRPSAQRLADLLNDGKKKATK